MKVFICILSIIIAGLLSPAIMRWVMNIQKRWKRKIFIDNGRMDIIDEINASRNRKK